MVRVSGRCGVQEGGREERECSVGLEATDVGALVLSMPTPIPRRPDGTKDNGRRLTGVSQENSWLDWEEGGLWFELPPWGCRIGLWDKG